MSDVDLINRYLQLVLDLKGQDSATAVEAARWLDAVELLKDSDTRPGKPLRDLLRAGQIIGQRQEANTHWFIDRVSKKAALNQ